MKFSKFLLMPMVAILAASPAMAESVTGTVNVSAEVAAKCNFTMSEEVSSTYNPATETGLAMGVSFICSKGVAYSFSANQGVNGADTANRLMRSVEGDDLRYTLDVAGVNLGQGAGETKDGVGSGSADAFNVVFKIPSGQYVKPGAYSDTVTVSLTY